MHEGWQAVTSDRSSCPVSSPPSAQHTLPGSQSARSSHPRRCPAQALKVSGLQPGATASLRRGQQQYCPGVVHASSRHVTSFGVAPPPGGGGVAPLLVLDAPSAGAPPSAGVPLSIPRLTLPPQATATASVRAASDRGAELTIAAS
jgi:hypothetical protein